MALPARPQGREELLIAIMAREATRGKIFIRFALASLPFRCPEPRLRRIDHFVRLEQDAIRR
jgi:hypothetical protein